MATSVTLNNGKKMPLLGLGTWKSKPGEVEAAVKKALDLGYRHFDCAHVYGNENEVGAGLKYGLEELKIPREELFVTSKLWNTCHNVDDVEPACKGTLSALGLSYLDLYLIHWPHGYKRGGDSFPRKEDGTIDYDFNAHPTDTWLAMEKLVEKGMTRSIGLSNFNSVQIKDVIEKGKIKPVTNQVESHPYLNQNKLRKFCDEYKIVLTAYSPLGSPDRPWASPDEPKLLDDPKIVDIGKKYNKTAAQVVLRWQVQRGVIAIPKSVTPSRIEENFQVFDFSLTEEEMATIDSFDCNGRLIEPKVNGKPRDAHHPHYPFNIEF